MAGTIFGLPLSIQIDDNGDPLAFCKLSIYDAGTTTPATTYEDFGLTTGLELSFPLVADAAGRIPQFWVADGSYRVRLVDADGNEIFDLDGVTAIGASSGTSSGGSGVSSSAVFQTGDTLWTPSTGTRTGWVRMNSKTIGSSSSGGTERASSDCEDLFLFLWNNFQDDLAPVLGGRGASAANDWSANKAITLPDMRLSAPFGVSDMGNTNLSSLIFPDSVGDSTTGGAWGGKARRTIAQNNLPIIDFVVSGTAATHTHAVSGTTATEGAHTHSVSGTTSGQSQSHTHSYTDRGDSTTANPFATGGGNTPADDTSSSYTTGSNSVDHTHTFSATSGAGSAHSHAFSVTSGASGTLALTGTAASGGSGTDLETMPYFMLGTWYMKL